MKSRLLHTKHSMMRQAQRAIKNEEIEIILEMGDEHKIRGGATKLIVNKDVIRNRIAYLKQLIKTLQKVAGVALVINDDSIISVMHQTKKVRFEP